MPGVIALGRRCALDGEAEVSALRAGLDFRLPRYRREVFLRFYEFHLRHRAHPGCVYYLLPWLGDHLGLDQEQRLWLAFLNGNTQNPVTSYLIFRRYPNPAHVDLADLEAWCGREWARLAFDTDRRYQKKYLPQAARAYLSWAQGDQAGRLAALAGSPSRGANFRPLWAWASRLPGFGRLATFSYLEYLRITGVPVDCDDLLLGDHDGSRSHRNGLCKVLGRDDLDWHDGNPGFDGVYPPHVLAWLGREAELLLGEARARAAGQPWAGDVDYFTLESTLCTYKGWHRVDRRYPNVYNDMLHGRILQAERLWGERMGLFWEARRACLPAALRCEDNPRLGGLCPPKQNHYRLTGEVIVMDLDWPCFANSYLSP